MEKELNQPITDMNSDEIIYDTAQKYKYKLFDKVNHYGEDHFIKKVPVAYRLCKTIDKKSKYLKNDNGERDLSNYNSKFPPGFKQPQGTRFINSYKRHKQFLSATDPSNPWWKVQINHTPLDIRRITETPILHNYKYKVIDNNCYGQFLSDISTDIHKINNISIPSSPDEFIKESHERETSSFENEISKMKKTPIFPYIDQPHVSSELWIRYCYNILVKDGESSDNITAIRYIEEILSPGYVPDRNYDKYVNQVNGLVRKYQMKYMDHIRLHAAQVIRRFYLKYIKNQTSKKLTTSFRSSLRSPKRNKKLTHSEIIMCVECNTNKAVLHCTKCPESKDFCPSCWVDMHVFININYYFIII